MTSTATSVVTDKQVELATKKLSKAISKLNRETIEFLAHDLQNHTTYSNTWKDCPMTLAQKIGNTLKGATEYKSRSNVTDFAEAWDSFMMLMNDRYGHQAHSKKQLTNGFGVGVVSELAKGDLRRRAASRKSFGDKIMERTTTACVREALAEDQIRDILVAMGQQHKLAVPDNLIDPNC